MGKTPGDFGSGVPLKILVTARDLLSARKTRGALRALFPDARILKTAFKGIFLMEAEGEPTSVIARIYQELSEEVGHVTLVCREVESSMDPVRDACVAVGLEHVRVGESFCFRVHKRGDHNLPTDTPSIEREIGGAIFEALEKRDGVRPKVNLRSPDVMVVAEVMGRSAAVGIVRKEWLPPSLQR